MKRWINFEISYYNYQNDYKRPYGTMLVSIRCGIVNISFEIKPNDIKKFITGILTGKDFKFEGECDINAGKLNSKLNEFQKDTIVSYPEHSIQTKLKQERLEKAFYEIETSMGNQTDAIKKFIKELEDIYNLNNKL